VSVLQATIRTLARYPVKSMRGEDLPSFDLGLQGVPEDRRYAFVQAESRSIFPWLTGRELAPLLLYRPFFDDGQPRPKLMVATPEGNTWPIDSDDLRKELEERSGRPLYLLRDYRGSYDVAQVSLISFATTEHIAADSGTPHEPRRFRMNMYVDFDGGTPFIENQLAGKILRLGDTARVAITEPDKRCMMITLDPDTGTTAPSVLRTVAQGNNSYAGVYGVVLTPGTIRQGDRITVES
jgi:uncharacterized protein